jgi:DNA polymerase-1
MIVTAANVHEVESYLDAQPYASCDTETYGLNYSDRLFSIIVGSGDRAFYFNFKDYPDEQIYTNSSDTELLTGALTRILAKPKTWFLHNAKFDLHKLRNFGLEVSGIIWDTKVNARILQNNLLDYSLENLCKGQKYEKSTAVDEYIDKHKLYTNRTVAGKAKKFKDMHYDRVPFSIIVPYGCGDALATYELGFSQLQSVERTPLHHGLVAQENELLRVVFEMESHGIKIDPDFVMAAWKHEEEEINQLKREFYGMTGMNFDDAGKADFVRILQEAGEKIPVTDKGNPSLKGDFLEEMSSPIAKIIQRIRFYEKRISSFYSTFMQYRDSNNIIHANFDQAGTETGRFSASAPNLQQLSKDDEEDEKDQEKYPVRGCFVPRPGTVFVQWDYKQQEYRLMADYANESGLIARVNEGYDIHKATAELVGVTRQQAKTVNFSILYGSGPAKLGRSLGISLAEAKKLIDKYFSALPRVEALIDSIRSKGRANGFITSTFGMKWNIASRDWNYILPNHLIKGTGAYVAKKAMVHIARMLIDRKAKSRLVAMIHDSVILEMYPEEFDLCNEVTRIMETVYESKNGVKLTTDIEWSAKSLAKHDLTKGYPSVTAA